MATKDSLATGLKHTKVEVIGMIGQDRGHRDSNGRDVYDRKHDKSHKSSRQDAHERHRH